MMELEEREKEASTSLDDVVNLEKMKVRVTFVKNCFRH